MDIKCKTCDTEPGINIHVVFLDISSTNIDTLVPSLYQCVERSLLTVVSATSAPGRASSENFELS
jgi:hypothetical protein